MCVPFRSGTVLGKHRLEYIYDSVQMSLFDSPIFWNE